MNKYTLVTQAYAKACRAMTKGAVAILRTYICCEDTLHSCELLLTEATANCACHAYDHPPIGDAEIILEVNPGHTVTMQISDWGVGFPQVYLDNIPRCPPKPEAESGRGLYIISALASEFHITQVNGQNTIHATLNVPGDLWMH